MGLGEYVGNLPHFTSSLYHKMHLPSVDKFHKFIKNSYVSIDFFPKMCYTDAILFG